MYLRVSKFESIFMDDIFALSFAIHSHQHVTISSLVPQNCSTLPRIRDDFSLLN